MVNDSEQLSMPRLYLFHEHKLENKYKLQPTAMVFYFWVGNSDWRNTWAFKC